MDITTAPHWSFSSLSCYMRCPLQYAFRYIEGCETERTSVCLPFGRAFHAVMSERAAKGPRYQLEEAKEAFAEHFRSETEAADNLTYKPDEDFGACLSKGFDVLSVALAGWSDTEVIAVAERFSISIPAPPVITLPKPPTASDNPSTVPMNPVTGIAQIRPLGSV